MKDGDLQKGETYLGRQKRLARGSAGDVGRRRRAGSGGFEGDREGAGSVRESPDSRSSGNDEGRTSAPCATRNDRPSKKCARILAPSKCARILHRQNVQDFCTAKMCKNWMALPRNGMSDWGNVLNSTPKWERSEKYISFESKFEHYSGSSTPKWDVL